MRELELPTTEDIADCPRLAVIGQGRLGYALRDALAAASLDPAGPFGRGADGAGFDAVLLCVPDAEIAAAAERIVLGPLIGHCSGATGLEVLGSREGFSLHPLMTVAGPGARFAGAGAAIAGNSDRALRLARLLADKLDMEGVEVSIADRTAYHAAASIASNFLVTIESVAERLAATAGVDRRMLVPLIRATVENWAALGSAQALTGPVARGDEATVAMQRDAVAERTPDLLPLFDALVDATRSLAAGRGLEVA
jgi:predicted short-subunit dehydrogenase-like oxidoreductase (DUF2520 family)